MKETTKSRLALARKNAAYHAANPKVKAILLTGSVTQSGGDDFSDVDMTVYYHEVPSEAEYEAAVATARESGGDLYYGTASEGFAIYQYIDGIRCDFGHGLASQVAELLQEFLDKPDLEDMNKQIVVSGFLDGQAMYGHDWVESWQAKLRDYPPGLGQALVEKYLRFHPHWVVEKMGVERDDMPFLYETFLQAEQNIFGVLCGLNQVYYPGKLKGIEWTVGKMKLVPPNLATRFAHILLAEPQAAAAELRDLIEETVTLVETHMPQVDITRVRKILPMVLRK